MFIKSIGLQHWRDITQLLLDRKSRLVRTRDGYADTEDEPRRHNHGRRGAEGAYSTTPTSGARRQQRLQPQPMKAILTARL